MSAALVLPMVWATATAQVESPKVVAMPGTRVTPRVIARVDPEVAFYRKYTEAMLQRYVRMAMEAGRVPSLLGQEMFRGKVTSYRVDSFEDVVIFVHDVERCLGRLDAEQQRLVSRIALQQYTVAETSALLRMRPTTVVRRYREAVDRLTRIFLEVRMLEPQKACQGEGD